VRSWVPGKDFPRSGERPSPDDEKGAQSEEAKVVCRLVPRSFASVVNGSVRELGQRARLRHRVIEATHDRFGYPVVAAANGALGVGEGRRARPLTRATRRVR
jgi:hypothetical protein